MCVTWRIQVHDTIHSYILWYAWLYRHSCSQGSGDYDGNVVCCSVLQSVAVCCSQLTMTAMTQRPGSFEGYDFAVRIKYTYIYTYTYICIYIWSDGQWQQRQLGQERGWIAHSGWCCVNAHMCVHIWTHTYIYLYTYTWRWKSNSAKKEGVSNLRWCCGEVWCNVVQCIALCCTVLQFGAVWCSMLQCVAMCCTVSQRVAVNKPLDCFLIWGIA